MMIEKRINPVILAQVDLYLNQVDEIPEECIRKKNLVQAEKRLEIHGCTYTEVP